MRECRECGSRDIETIVDVEGTIVHCRACGARYREVESPAQHESINAGAEVYEATCGDIVSLYATADGDIEECMGIGVLIGRGYILTTSAIRECPHFDMGARLVASNEDVDIPDVRVIAYGKGLMLLRANSDKSISVSDRVMIGERVYVMCQDKSHETLRVLDANISMVDYRYGGHSCYIVSGEYPIGSIVVDASRNMVGMVMGCAEGNSYTMYVHDMRTFLDHIDRELHIDASI